MNSRKNTPARVLIVDDSALIRQLLTEILGRDGNIEVVGTAPDPFVARDMIKALNPDVITLDIEMPRMDGLAFLERLMALRPMPVVVVSTLTQKGADAALRSLELGAVDYVAKPLVDIRQGIGDLGHELVAKVKAAAGARVGARIRSETTGRSAVFDHLLSTTGTIVGIGASTGGVEALQTLLTGLPANVPAMLITQHMPAGFTASFAKRLDERCRMSVSEATDGIRVTPGHVYIAPGNWHLELARSGAHYFCHLHDSAPLSGHRPSVDMLFNSIATVAGENAIGVILTGMGSDGAAGLLRMRQAGARTLGQDESSCMIYGMPRAAKLLGAVESEFPLSRLPRQILDRCRARRPDGEQVAAC
jgi:two-component system, chemotaxis family, protein-glutamate methylesterase/glutaminase